MLHLTAVIPAGLGDVYSRSWSCCYHWRTITGITDLAVADGGTGAKYWTFGINRVRVLNVQQPRLLLAVVQAMPLQQQVWLQLIK
jgi:hypothetical protein